jgi:hypothetical protein
MDTTFAGTIDQWHDFYITAGTASATLIGLLFVSVSLHADFITDPAAEGVLASARRAFTGFITVVLIALMFVIPAQSPRGLGFPLVAFSLVYLQETVHIVGILRREHTHLADLIGSTSNLGRIGTGLISSVGLLIISLTILSGSTNYLNWLVAVIGVLLIGAAQNCWSLLLDIAVAKRRIAERQAAPATPVTPAALDA